MTMIHERPETPNTPPALRERTARRDATPMSAGDLYDHLTGPNECQRSSLVHRVLDRVIAGGLDLDQSGRSPDDPMLSVREVRAVYDAIDTDIERLSFQFHTECCPRFCDVDRWHDSAAEAAQLGYVEHGYVEHGYVEHGSVVARGRLPESRGLPGRVTRPDAGLWRLEDRQRVHREGAEGALVEDEVLVLVHQDPGEVGTTRGREVRMLPGEVLQLARAMVEAVGSMIALDSTD